MLPQQALQNFSGALPLGLARNNQTPHQHTLPPWLLYPSCT